MADIHGDFMKKLVTILALLFFLSAQLMAYTSSEQARANIAGAYFDELNSQGEFSDMDQSSIDLAKQIVQSIASDPAMLRDYQNGNLVLDEQYVDYFLKDSITGVLRTAGSVKDKVSDVLKPVKDVLSTALSPVKKLTAGIAHIANKSLSAIVDNDAIMTLLDAGIGVLNTLIPYGGAALFSAVFASSVTFPPLAILLPVITAAIPVLEVVVTPNNVATALKVARATASLADQFLNKDKQKATTAPDSSLIALEKKAAKPAKEVGEALELTFKGGSMLQSFIKKAKQSGQWKKFSEKEQKELLRAADKANKIAGLIDPAKLPQK